MWTAHQKFQTRKGPTIAGGIFKLILNREPMVCAPVAFISTQAKETLAAQVMPSETSTLRRGLRMPLLNTEMREFVANYAARRSTSVEICSKTNKHNALPM